MEETLRLMVYQGAYWPLFNGYGNHLRHRLRLLPRYGVEPWVLTHRSEGLPAEEVVDDVLVRRIEIPGPMSRRSMYPEIALFPAFQRYRSDYDLALISSANVAGPFIRQICRRPVVREVIIGDDHAAKFKRGLRGQLMEAAFRGVDFAVVISPALEQGYLDVGWSPERMRLIPRGVDSDIFRPASSISEVDELRADLGLPQRPAPIFLTIGAIRERKGHADLVEVWGCLSTVLAEEHLVIVGPVGDEGYYRMLLGRVEELGLGSRVHFVGRSDRTADYLRCADAFVFASNNEGFPNSIIEAMSSGLPVVAFDIEGILPYIIETDRDGIIVSARDQESLRRTVLRLSKDAAWRKTLGMAARQTVIRRFSLQEEAEAHARLYRSLVGRAAGCRADQGLTVA